MKEKKTSNRKPTVREKRLIEEMAKPDVKSKRKAAINAGYAPSTASTIIYKKLEDTRISDAIQNRIDRALKHHKVTPEEIIGSAVFQMRSSVNDVLGDDGGFDLEKARANGSIDLVKKLEITEKPIFGTDKIEKTYKVEMLSNESGRKEVANYAGVEKTPQNQTSPDELARAMFNFFVERMIRDGMEQKERELRLEKIVQRVRKDYPAFGVKLLEAGK